MLDDPPIATTALPAGALLARYATEGAYTDCYVADIARSVTQAEYVEAFYTAPVFRLERLLLAVLVKRPSTDGQARALAAGSTTRFAAWDVEARTDNQLLMCDLLGRTRSWLMSEPSINGEGTRLYFGSAVVPVRDGRTGAPRIGFAYRALLGFHRAYSRVLLHGARERLSRRPKMTSPRTT